MVALPVLSLVIIFFKNSLSTSIKNFLSFEFLYFDKPIFKKLFNSLSPEKLIETYKKILSVISPIIPHFANECMDILDVKADEVYWPKVDETYLAKDTIKFIVQINGKTRKIIETKKNTTEKELL